MHSLSRSNLQEFCRTCLGSLPTTTKNTNFSYNLSQFPRMLDLVIMLTSLEDAQFPRSLCQLCFDKLRDIQDFQKLAVQTTCTLRDFLAHDIKEEITDDQSSASNNENEERLQPDMPFDLHKPLKSEDIEINETQLANVNIYGTSFDESLNNAADDADDEEGTLPNGAANNSSASTTKSFKCPRCEKHTYKKVYLDAHILAVHEGHDKPFSCESCDKAFKRYHHLVEHIKAIHDLEQNMCTHNGCNRSFKTKKLLQAHFAHTHAISESENLNNLDLEESGQVSDESLKNVCVHCSRPYSSKRALVEHLKRHAQIKDHVCQVCGVAKVTRTELVTHMRTHERNVTKFNCTMCPQQFSHKNAINRHVRVVHEGQRRYQCTYCVKRFGTRNSQKVHERLHTGERPYSCGMCIKSFAQNEALKSHMKNHDKKLRKHVCSHCTQRFITRKNLIDHEKRHKGDKPYICIKCNKGFRSANDLNTHALYHNNEEQVHDT